MDRQADGRTDGQTDGGGERQREIDNVITRVLFMLKILTFFINCDAHGESQRM